MSHRYWVAAVLVTLVIGPVYTVAADEPRPLREGVRLPILGPDREPIDLLETRPAEVERLLSQREAPQLPLLLPLIDAPEAPEVTDEPPEDAPEQAAEVIEVERFWLEASAAGAGSEQGEAALSNTAEKSHRLVAVYTEVAEEALLFVPEHQNGIQQVRRLSDLQLPAEQRVEIRPGGPRLLLVDLRRPLNQGEAVTLVLQFDDGSRKSVEVPVRRPLRGG